MNKKILFAFKADPSLKDYIISKLDSRLNYYFTESSKEEAILPQLENVSVLVGWRFTDKIFEKAKTLETIINPGAGVQHIVEAFKTTLQKKNIRLMNSHGNAYFTAQHTVALLLSLSNKVILHHNLLKNGQWRSGDKEGISIPLRNKRIGLLGYGAVNRNVHQMLQGFGCRFSICKNKKWLIKPENCSLYSIEQQQLEHFLKEIDILIAAVPSTAESKHLIAEHNIHLLKKNSLVLNVGRGDLIEEKALYSALKENKITGAAIDVWYNYRPEPDEEGRKYPYQYPFHELNNIILSPHRAASPMNDLERWNDVIHNLNESINEKPEYINVIDLQQAY